MNSGLIAALTDNERSLVAETEPVPLAALDEDAAMELEARIRRARNKYTGQYRRTAAGRVPQQGGRGMARPQNKRAAMKAEAFEDALARVTRRVSILSRQAARELRHQRLAAARRDGSGHGPESAAGSTVVAAARIAGRKQTQVADRRVRTPATEKQRASTMAHGARRQARRDSR